MDLLGSGKLSGPDINMRDTPSSSPFPKPAVDTAGQRKKIKMAAVTEKYLYSLLLYCFHKI